VAVVGGQFPFGPHRQPLIEPAGQIGVGVVGGDPYDDVRQFVGDRLEDVAVAAEEEQSMLVHGDAQGEHALVIALAARREGRAHVALAVVDIDAHTALDGHPQLIC